MNKIFKVVWSKTKNSYVVVSEIAKRSGKCSSSLNKKLIAVFLAAGTVMSVTGSAWAADMVKVDGNEDANARGANSIAIGTGAETGDAEHSPLASHAVAVGPFAYTPAMYSSVLGAFSGITVDYSKTMTVGSKENRVFQGFGATVLGALNNSQTLATEQTPNPFTESGFESVANGIVGTANSVTNSNGSLVYGAGNTITNSYQNVFFGDPTKTKEENEALVNAMLEKYDQALATDDNNVRQALMGEVAGELRKLVKISGGQVMAMGGQNNATNAYRSQIIGVGNELSGSKPVKDTDLSTDDYTFYKYDTQYDLLDGFENKVGHSEHVSVIGTANNVQDSSNNVIYGDYHGLSKGSENNVIIGSNTPTIDENSTIGFGATAHKAGISDTVMVGHGADVKVDGGAALGSGSLGNTDAGIRGYDPTTGTVSINDSSTWKATKAAVSVGNSTRTWYKFSTNALKTAIENNKDRLISMGIDTGLEPEALLASLSETQLKILVDAVNPAEVESEKKPSEQNYSYVDRPGTGTTRQITNVAAGFEDTDAVNVAQLKGSQIHYYSVNDNGAKLRNYNNDGAVVKYAVASGVNAEANGLLSTVVGANSIASDPLAVKLQNIKLGVKTALNNPNTSFSAGMMLGMVDGAIKNLSSVNSAGATVLGSMNSTTFNTENIQGVLTAADNLITLLNANKPSGSKILNAFTAFQEAALASPSLFVGSTDTIVGTMNESADSNGSVVYGTGNKITGSYEDYETSLVGNTNITKLTQLIASNDIDGIKKLILENYISKEGGKGGRSIAIGTNNTIINAKQAIAFGTNNNVTGDKSIAVGIGHTISGANSGAFGDPSTISGNNSYAIGNDNTIAVNDAFVLGNDAQATADNVVALGNKSIAGAAATVNGYDPVTSAAHVLASDEEDDLQIQSVWKATAGTVSVGGGTMKRMNEQGEYLNESGSVVQGADQAADIPMTRQITNVAAGSKLTDAVNVAQLMAAQVEIVGGDNVEVIKENSNGHTKYTIHSLNAMIAEKGENITVTADTPKTTEETNGKTTDLTAEGDGTTGETGNTGGTGGTTAEPTPSPEGEQITPSDKNNHTTTYTIDAKDTRNTVKAGENITVKEKNNDDGSITYTISAQAATNVKVIDGENTTVTEGKDGDFTTYAVNVKTDGEVASGNTGIVTGDTVYNETRVKKDGNYIKKDNTAAENITELDKRLGENTQNITNIYNDVNNMDNRMKKGLAGAAALAALHPMDFNPDDKLQFSAGVGNYRGETAAALGMFYRPDESVMFSIGGTFGNSDNMINAGITFGLDGTRNRITRSRTAMAREIQDLRSLVTQMAARMDRLEGANVETAMFPDVPENHWAYEYVEDLQKRGALKGYPDGLFKGDRAMTRYEFAAMLDRLVRSGVMLDSKIAKEFEPELGRIYVERISGQDNDRKKVERVRVNNSDSKYPEGKTRDVYGSKIVTEVPKTAEAK